MAVHLRPNWQTWSSRRPADSPTARRRSHRRTEATGPRAGAVAVKGELGMDDLVLRSRLEAVRRTLAKVKNVREALEAQRLQFHQLDEMLSPQPEESLQRRARAIKTAIDQLVYELEDRQVTRQPPDLRPFITEVRRAATTAETLREQANKALTLVEN